MIHFVLPFLLATVAVRPPAPAHQKWPAEVARALYADHLKHDMGFSKASVARKAKWLSPDLLAKLNAELARPANPDEVPAINGDPFTDSQEYPKRFVVGKAEIIGDATRIPVVLTGNGRRRTVAVKLRNTPDGWRVDDLIYEDGSSLRSLLGK